MATFPITGTFSSAIVGAPLGRRFVIHFDQMATFTPGATFEVSGHTTSDGTYTVSSSTYHSPPDGFIGSPGGETRIFVLEPITTGSGGNIIIPPGSGSPPTGSPPTGSPPTGSPPTGSPPTGSPPTGSPLFSGSPINTGSPIGDDEMFLINHNYTVGDTVYYIDNGAVKTGVVLKVEIIILSTGTTINYILQVESNSVTVEESLLYGNCRAEGGYQDIVFTAALSSSTVVIPVGSTLAGSTLTGNIAVDGGTPIPLSYAVLGMGSPVLVDTAVSVQDILNNLNGVLNPLADAFIYQNNIRIRSRTTGPASTILIEDGTGSPLSDKYFENLLNYTGLAAPVVGLGDGAIDNLGNQIC